MQFSLSPFRDTAPARFEPTWSPRVPARTLERVIGPQPVGPRAASGGGIDIASNKRPHVALVQQVDTSCRLDLTFRLAARERISRSTYDIFSFPALMGKVSLVFGSGCALKAERSCDGC